MMGFGMGAIGLLWLFFFLLLPLGVVALVIWAVRMSTANRSATISRESGGHSTARAILDERYAKGEITAEEYERMKKDLAS